MIPFVDKLRKTDSDAIIVMSFDNSYWNKFITLRVLSGIVVSIVVFLYQLTILPFIFLFSTLDVILEVLINIPIKIYRKLSFKKSLNKYVKSLDEKGKLKLSDYTHPRSISLRNFIFNFIKKYKDECFTLDMKDDIICDTHRRRSAGDIYRICKTYYPDCTFDDVMKILIKLCIDVEIGASRCTTINKFVFHRDSYHFVPKGDVEYVPHTNFKDIMKYYGFK